MPTVQSDWDRGFANGLTYLIDGAGRQHPARTQPAINTKGAQRTMPVGTVSIVLTLILALMLTLSAAMKLQRNDQVVASIHGVTGVPLSWFPVLAGLELAGAVGLVVGLWIAPLGIAAAVGVVAYFVGAVVAHLRVGDTKGVASPALPLVLSVAALVLHILNA